MGSTFRMQRGAYRFDITFGPDLPFSSSPHAALQLSHCGHSWALLACSQIQMRKVDDWKTLAQPISRSALNLVV